MSKEIVDRVRALVEPILSDERMELVEIQYHREAHGWVLRFTIDKEGGVTLEDCSRINHDVGRTLDVEDFICDPLPPGGIISGPQSSLKKRKGFSEISESVNQGKNL